MLYGAAAFVVLLTHARTSAFVGFGALPVESQGWMVRALFAATRLGHEAVIVFFALSGFLVAGRALEAAANSRFIVSHYAVDRITRILVPLVWACIVTAFITYILDGSFPAFSRIAANSLGLNGIVASTLKYNSPLWSLAFEVWFYLLLGAALGIRAFPVGCACAGFLGLIAFTHLNVFYLLLWIIGAISFVYRHQLALRSFSIVGTLLMIVGSVMFQLQSDSQAIARYPVPWTASQAEVLICFGTALLLPTLLLSNSTSRLGGAEFAARLFSDFSYSLYLTHAPLLALLLLYWPMEPQVDLRSMSLFLCRIIICLVFAWLFHLCFERSSYVIRTWLKGTIVRHDLSKSTSS